MKYYTYNDAESEEGNYEKAQGYSEPLLDDPVCEEGKEKDSEDEESANIEQSVDFVSGTILGLVSYDQQLASVQEDRVDLHHQWQRHEGHELFGDHRHGVAEDDQRVVEEELVGTSLPVIEDHISRIIEEVSDGEADESVTRERELSLEILLHVGLLDEGRGGPGARDEGVDQAGHHVPPLPSLLGTLGGGGRSDWPSQEVDQGECCCSTQYHKWHLSMSWLWPLPHSNAATSSTADVLQAPGGGKLGPVPLLLPTADCSLLTPPTPLTTQTTDTVE